jgi:hypothetical protein
MPRPTKYYTLEELREAQRKSSKAWYEKNKHLRSGNAWIAKFKETDPEGYKEYNRNRRREYLANLRENFPDKYKALIEKERLRQKAVRDAKKAGNDGVV